MERCRNGLEDLFKRFKGHPVEILTGDGVRYCGIDIESNDENIEIVDSCNRVIFIPYKHITAVVEPKMRLDRFCSGDNCNCDGKGCGRGDND